MPSSALQRAFPAARPVGNQKVIAREVADQLREVIVSGRLRPGERLTELELANLFQVSRSPLREAFLQLENEGLVTLVPRKGAIVSEVSEADIRELYQVKGVLEGYVAGLVARRRDAATLGKLEGLMQQMQRAAQHGDLRRYLKLSEEFYALMFSVADNRRLETMYETVRVPIKRIRALSLASKGRLSQSASKHQAIFDAIKAGQANRAEQLAREHSQEVREEILKGFSELIRRR